MDTIKFIVNVSIYTGGWYVFFGVLERFFPAGPHKSLQGWLLNLKVLGLQLVADILLAGVIVYVARTARDLSGGGLLDLRFDTGYGALTAIGATLLSMLIRDFFYYWYHRMQHEHKALWAIHKLHHMDETFGVSTNGRVSWLEKIGNLLFIVFPIAFLFEQTSAGLGGGVVMAFIGLLLSGGGAFNHANLKLSLGPFTRVIVGPQLHRIHHSRLLEHFDRNYAARFPIFDILFGTYYHPKRGEFPPTGVRTDPDINTLTEAELIPLRAWGSLLGVRSAGCTGVLWCDRGKS